jgi:hypothetical protein
LFCLEGKTSCKKKPPYTHWHSITLNRIVQTQDQNWLVAILNSW